MFFIALIFTSSVALSQSLDDINKMMLLNQTKKAKELVDKFLSDPKNATKAEAWFYKGRIYNNASKEEGLTPEESLKLKNESFEALKNTNN